MRTYLLQSMGEEFGPFDFDLVRGKLVARQFRPSQSVSVVEDGKVVIRSSRLEELDEFRDAVERYLSPAPSPPIETSAMNASFRSAFRIPDGHELRCESWRGGLTGACQEWHHHEFDEAGAVLARFESWLHESPDGVDTGYRKYDPYGVVVEQGRLPPLAGR